MVNFFRKIKRYFREERVLKNIFKTNYSKSALISYTVLPFFKKKETHTNNAESKLIAKIFNELGFNVDVVHYTNESKIDYSRYEVIFGFGEAFENSFTKKKKIRRVYYATGAHVCYQNYAEIKRVEKVNKKYNSNLLPKRLVPFNWAMSTSLSDALVVIGNEWTKSTYTKYTKSPVMTINATALVNKNSSFIERDISRTRREFLWFGSAGLIHKGLDLCLEYFSQNSDLKLHICGSMEEGFLDTFRKQLDKPNITCHGFINVSSQKFIDIVSMCSFAILPTCSEGQATSLLTTMHAGLVPLSTRFSGIDIEKFGYLLGDTDLESVKRAVKCALSVDNVAIEQMSQNVSTHIKKKHTVNVFETNMKAILRRLLVV